MIIIYNWRELALDLLNLYVSLADGMASRPSLARGLGLFAIFKSKQNETIQVRATCTIKGSI
jgi:hypothetical protein